MKVTSESTSADDRERERRDGTVLWGKTKVLLDELERLRASKPDDAHARACRTAKLEQLIGNAVESIRAKLEQQHQTFRTSAVLDHMWIKRDLYGITRLPTRKVVQRVLVKQGLYVIGL